MRPGLIPLLALTVLLPAVAASEGASPAPAAAPRWNVILISADTLRGDMLGSNGNTLVKTPNLDRLAREGVNFSRAYANITTTTPSHAAMLTSLYPHDHRAFDNQAQISAAVTTLPELLGERGWHTAGIVNMPWLNPEVTGVTQGIKELARGDRVRKADKTTAWVSDFLARRAKTPDDPFFLFVHFTDNHTPYHAPGAYERLYYPKDKDPRAGKSGSLQKVWPLFPKDHRDNAYFKKWIGDVTDAEFVVATYRASVTWLDHHVGRIMDALKAHQLWENTIFVFTGDHGESLGEHGIWFAHGGLFEPTVHVPLLVRVPGGPAGRQVSTVVDLVDIVPTVLGRVGLPPPAGARGEDLWTLATEEGEVPGAALLEHTGRQLTGVVTQKWKYIRHLKTRLDIYPSYAIRKGTLELYDLEADPGETKNLAKARPEVVKELEALMQRLQQGGRSFQAGKAKVDAETEEALRALGYIQ